MVALVIGKSSYEITSFLNDSIIENTVYNNCNKEEGSGGSALVMASLLGKWGVDTHISTAVASDANGEKIKKELDMYRINKDMVETNFDKETFLSYILINKKNGSKTLFNLTNPEDFSKCKKTDFNMNPDIILMDGFEHKTSTAALNKFPNTPSIILADEYTPEVLELAKYSKYIVFSKTFLEKFTNMVINKDDSNSLLNLFNVVKSRYPRNEIILFLEDFGVIYSIDNQIKVIPVIKVEKKDTQGSIEIFTSTFAYSLVNNYDLEKAITYSIISSCMSNIVYGSIASIPNFNNVASYYNQKFGIKTNDNL